MYLLTKGRMGFSRCHSNRETSLDVILNEVKELLRIQKYLQA